MNQSYPSGHVAASSSSTSGSRCSIAIALGSAAARDPSWALAHRCYRSIVALSRMYRGMHHPIDVTAGVLIGLGVDRDRAVRDARGRRSGSALHPAPTGTRA